MSQRFFFCRPSVTFNLSQFAGMSTFERGARSVVGWLDPDIKSRSSTHDSAVLIDLRKWHKETLLSIKQADSAGKGKMAWTCIENLEKQIRLLTDKKKEAEAPEETPEEAKRKAEESAETKRKVEERKRLKILLTQASEFLIPLVINKDKDEPTKTWEKWEQNHPKQNPLSAHHSITLDTSMKKILREVEVEEAHTKIKDEMEKFVQWFDNLLKKQEDLQILKNYFTELKKIDPYKNDSKIFKDFETFTDALMTVATRARDAKTFTDSFKHATQLYTTMQSSAEALRTNEDMLKDIQKPKLPTLPTLPKPTHSPQSIRENTLKLNSPKSMLKQKNQPPKSQKKQKKLTGEKWIIEVTSFHMRFKQAETRVTGRQGTASQHLADQTKDRIVKNVYNKLDEYKKTPNDKKKKIALLLSVLTAKEYINSTPSKGNLFTHLFSRGDTTRNLVNKFDELLSTQFPDEYNPTQLKVFLSEDPELRNSTYEKLTQIDQAYTQAVKEKEAQQQTRWFSHSKTQSQQKNKK